MKLLPLNASLNVFLQAVKPESKAQYRLLDCKFNHFGNFAGYRAALRGLRPAVPFCGRNSLKDFSLRLTARLAPHKRDVLYALHEMSPLIGMTEDSKEKRLININSYCIMMRTIRCEWSTVHPILSRVLNGL
jgi:hypothetical protein